MENNINPNIKVYPMNWFKFIIYAQLFLGAFFALSSSMLYFTGLQYQNLASDVYALYKGLKIVDILMGISQIVVAVLCIVVRQKLAHFKKDGPLWYLSIPVINTVILILYYIAVGILIGSGSVFSPSFWASLASNIVLFFVNKKYFDNRKHLFIY